MERYDVAVVGAGIAGASLAWRLAARCRVLLLERESQPGLHSTGRSAAMFMESYGPPQVRALTRAGRDFYTAPPAGFTDVPVLAPRGVLYVAAPGQQDLLDETWAALAGSGSRIERVSAADALARVPVLRPERVLAAIAEPDAMDVDVHALHQGFLRGLKRQGGVLRCDAEVESARRVGATWTLTLAGGERVQAATLVDAAGAWADDLAQHCGVPPVGLVPHRRSAFVFKPPEGLDAGAWPTVCGIDEGWYFKPDAGRLLGSPANADPVPPHDVVPEELDIALGIHRIEEATTLSIRRPERTWAGLRSFVPDGELVIGFDPAAEGFFWLAGQGGYGIQSAAGASALAASLLLGEALPAELASQGVDPAAVSPGRLR
ncbi:MAG: FAD-dependent oxidoreductase [Rubrivivax sp.]